MPAADRYATLLDPLRSRLARTPLPRWSRDAVRALLSLLPASWRRLVAGQEQRLGLLRRGDEVELVAATPRGDIVLGRLPLDDDGVLDTARRRLDEGGAPRWLLLPASLVLRRQLVLPVAAEARLREVLAFELDRQTPFSADQVSYQGQVTGRDAGGQNLLVDLLVLPRERLDAELLALGPLAAGIAGVDVAEADGRRLGVNLLPDARREQHRDPVARLNALLAGAALACLLGTLLMTLHNRAEKRDELRQMVATASEEARQARRLRNELAIAAQAANFLATTRAGRPTMVELLDDLTRRIPDDTFLDKLAVSDGKLVMVGQSRAAPALVALLQESPLLSEPALSGPVQADQRTGRDRFTLAADVVDARKPEVADAPRP